MDGVYDLAPDEYQLRVEAVDFDGVCKFFQFASTRLLTDQHGRLLAKVCVHVRQRARRSNGDPHIRVVVIDKPCRAFQERSRVYSGLMRVSTLPPLPIRRFMLDELKAGVPRNFMGRGVFGLGSKIYRYIWRHFGPPLMYFNADIRNAQPSLLYTAPILDDTMRARLPTIAENVNGRDGIMQRVLGGLNTRVSPQLGEGDVKTLVIAAMGQASLQKYMQDTCRPVFGPMNDDFREAVEILEHIKAEAVGLAEFIAAAFPSAAEYVRTHTDNWVGSLLRRYCNVLERRVVDRAYQDDVVAAGSGSRPRNGQVYYMKTQMCL